MDFGLFWYGYKTNTSKIKKQKHIQTPNTPKRKNPYKKTYCLVCLKKIQDPSLQGFAIGSAALVSLALYGAFVIRLRVAGRTSARGAVRFGRL